MANKALDAWIHAFPLELQRMEFADLAKEGTLSPEAQAMLEKEGQKAVWFMPLSSQERDEFELSFAKLDGKKRTDSDEKQARVRMANFTAKYVSFCWRDEKGAHMGTDKELGKLLPSVLMRDFYQVILKMNGMETDAVDNAGKD
jgi:hypothetical protein